MTCTKCRLQACSCLFEERTKLTQPVCLKCAGTATMDKLAEINDLQKAQGIQ